MKLKVTAVENLSFDDQKVTLIGEGIEVVATLRDSYHDQFSVGDTFVLTETTGKPEAKKVPAKKTAKKK